MQHPSLSLSLSLSSWVFTDSETRNPFLSFVLKSSKQKRLCFLLLALIEEEKQCRMLLTLPSEFSVCFSLQGFFIPSSFILLAFLVSYLLMQFQVVKTFVSCFFLLTQEMLLLCSSSWHRCKHPPSRLSKTLHFFHKTRNGFSFLCSFDSGTPPPQFLVSRFLLHHLCFYLFFFSFKFFFWVLFSQWSKNFGYLYSIFFFSFWFCFGGHRSKNFVSISHNSCGVLQCRLGFWLGISLSFTCFIRPFFGTLFNKGHVNSFYTTKRTPFYFYFFCRKFWKLALFTLKFTSWTLNFVWTISIILLKILSVCSFMAVWHSRGSSKKNQLSSFQASLMSWPCSTTSFLLGKSSRLLSLSLSLSWVGG